MLIKGSLSIVKLHETFAALGDPTRLAIVEQLLKSGESSAGNLCEKSKISRPAISRHLKVLLNARLVERRIDKQKRIYSVRPEAVITINAWTMDHHKFWQTSLDRLEKALKQKKVNK